MSDLRSTWAGGIVNSVLGNSSSPATFQVGAWEAHPNACRLARNGTEVKLSPRSMNVLVYLAERAGTAVTHEELIAEYWRGAISSPNAVHKCVAELRHAFGNGGGEPAYIETVPKRGYRLVAAVHRVEMPIGSNAQSNGFELIAAADGPASSASTIAQPGTRRTIAAAAVLCLSLATAGLAWWISRGHVFEAQVVTLGNRTAVMLPVDPSTHSDSDAGLLRTIQEKVIAQVATSTDAPIRSVNVGASDGDNANVATTLGVDYAVAMDMHEVGERVRASLTIVPASRDQPFHEEQFDAASADRLVVVDDLTSHAIDDLRVLLDERSVREMGEWGTKSVHAYRYAREGDSFRRMQGKGSLERAEEQYRRAISEDHTFSYAYQCLANVYLAMAWSPDGAAGREIPRRNMQALLRGASLQRLDPELVGRIARQYTDLSVGNAFDAEALWRGEILNDPADAEALRMYAKLLVGAKLVAENDAYIARAIALAPASWRDALESEYATTLQAGGHVEEAIRQMKVNIDNAPDFTLSLYGLVRSLAGLGRYAEAENYLARLTSSDAEWAHAARLVLQAQRGDLPKGSAALERALADPSTRNLTRGTVSFVVGDVEGGIRYWRQMEPSFVPLHWQYISSEERFWAKGVVEDPRYQAFLDELGIGKKWRAYMRAKAAELTPVTGIAVTSPVPPEDIAI